MSGDLYASLPDIELTVVDQKPVVIPKEVYLES